MEAFLSRAIFANISDIISCPHHVSVLRQVHIGAGPHTLSDGTRLTLGDVVGTIHINQNLHRLEHLSSHMHMMRRLYQNVVYDLRHLARLCEQDDKSVEHIHVFRGTSHLAGPLAKRLGFDTRKVHNPAWSFVVKHMSRESKARLRQVYAGLAQYGAPSTHIWDAYISREKLVSLYGSGTSDATVHLQARATTT